jgi:HEAT repeat protein
VLIEPALANWDYEPIRETWHGRVRDPHTNPREMVLALEGLAQSQDQEVLAEIVEIVLSGDRSPGLRLQAARAAGAIAHSGLESSAGQLMSLRDARTLHRLCAVALLDRHDSESARRQLLELARDAEPTVAEQALGRLNEIDPELVIPLAEAVRVNPDPKVRQHAADAYVALPSPERVSLLSQMLNDLHPDVRTRVADGLAALGARPELEVSVRESAFEVLAGDNWRGQEQAALILGVLDYEPAAARMVELLRSDRSEVEVAAAWGLRLLAVPEFLPEMLRIAQERTLEGRVDN